MSSTSCSMSDAPQRKFDPDEILEDQDEIDVELRSTVEIRTRILILSAVLRRLTLENAAASEGGDPTAEAFDEREWLREKGLMSELTPEEATLLNSPVGTLTPEAIIDSSWWSEALSALAWAIDIVELPPSDTISDPARVMDAVPRPWDEIHGWFGDPALVSESEVVHQREIAEIWHWRATTEVLRRSGSVGEKQDYEEAIRDVANEALDAGLVPTLRHGDFSVHGRSIKDLSGDSLEELVAVSRQRLRALNWLCGFGASWHDVPLDL
jgi:hypothetical protein